MNTTSFAFSTLVWTTSLWFASGVLHAQNQQSCECPVAEQPVCAADGETYGNECLAACHGLTVLYTGSCRWKAVEFKVETPHPCPNSYSERWSIVPPERTTMLRLHFRYVALQNRRDYLEVVSDAGPIARVSGLRLAFTLPVHAGKVDMTLVTDRMIRSYGFEMLGYEYLSSPSQNPCEAQAGYCIAVVPGSQCDHGYALNPDIACSGLGAQCCMPLSVGTCGGPEHIACSSREEVCWYETAPQSYGLCQPRFGDVPTCRAIGTRSEGWYWEGTGELIAYALCADEMAACFFTSANRSQGFYLVGQSPSNESLIAWDMCHAEPPQPSTEATSEQ